MQTLIRVGYATIAYDELQSSNLYLTKKNELERVCQTAQNLFANSTHKDMSSQLLAVNGKYLPDKNISLCLYKGYAFIGFYKSVGDKRHSNIIEFFDKSNQFHLLPSSVIKSLEYRIAGAIKDFEHSRHCFVSEHVAPAWKEAVPLLDKIVAFENRVKELPEDVRRKFKENLLYDECIDIIISTGSGYCPDLDDKINACISKAYKRTGYNNPEEELVQESINRCSNIPEKMLE